MSGARGVTAPCWRRPHAAARPVAVGVERTSDRARGAPERPGRAEGPAAAAGGIPLDRGSAGCRAARPSAPHANLGPTPRYAVIPRWGLVERFDTAEFEQQAEPRSGPSIAALRATLVATIAVLGLAALVHIVRYALLIINRDVLLNPVVAWLATWLGILVSVAALFLVFATLRAADELADRPAVGGVQTRWAPRTPTAVGAARRMPGAVCEPGMGAGLRSRTGQRRGRSGPASPADRGVVDGVGAVHGGVGVRHRDQLHHATPRASPTTRSRRSSPTSSRWRRWFWSAGCSRLRAQAGRANPPSAG